MEKRGVIYKIDKYTATVRLIHGSATLSADKNKSSAAAARMVLALDTIKTKNIFCKRVGCRRSDSDDTSAITKDSQPAPLKQHRRTPCVHDIKYGVSMISSMIPAQMSHRFAYCERIRDPRLREKLARHGKEDK